ncbi:MAG: enoyl-CoA hydratase/isomerase family protein [Gammaproteobacteria bacterium]
MNSEFSEIKINCERDIATITMDRPDALNAITPQMLAELNKGLEELASEETIRFVILTGAGKAFSAGVDLKALGDRKLINGKVGDILDVPAREVIERIETMPKPVIAKVNGFCFTGALEIALACDLIAVAKEAKLGDTHAKWGLRPTWGMSQRLPRRVGLLKARELSLTARSVSGEQCVAMGLANLSAPRDELDAAIHSLIDEMRPNSSEAFLAYKDLYRAAENRGLQEGLVYEAETDYMFTDSEQRLAAFRK